MKTNDPHLFLEEEDFNASDASDAPENAIENIEIDLLLEGIRRRFGYDFTHYSYASVKRRLSHARRDCGLTFLSEMLPKLLHDEQFFDHFLKYMSTPVTEMFRDPLFYMQLRTKLIPLLKTFPFVKIWHAGCATGEEAYSMAILLHEEGVLHRTRLYATDFNKHSLDTAQNGVYPLNRMQEYTANYQASGGKNSFSEYYSANYEFVKMKEFLKKHITFSYHNLVTDGIFGEMNVIICRNVMIYFDKTLQEQVLSLFTNSLRHGGFLCLGNKETLNFSNVKSVYETIDNKQKIYKKCGEYHATST